MKEIQVVGAAIIKQDRILALQRSEKMSMPLKWEFVGGKIEEGETCQQALKREVYEELGIIIKVGAHVAAGSSIINDKKIVLNVYKAEWQDGEITVNEHAQLKWAKADEIFGLDWAEADIPACLKLKEELEQKNETVQKAVCEKSQMVQNLLESHLSKPYKCR